MTEAALQTTDLKKTFQTRDGEVSAVDTVSFELQPGDFMALHGPSGCGKSTLLLMAGALMSPDSGNVTVSGQDPYSLGPDQRAAFRAERIGFVFQQFHLIPFLDVLDNILVGDLASNGSTNSFQSSAEKLLDRFQLSHRKHHTPSALSVGEQQRVALARALLRSPRLVLADEPTGNLDTENSKIILDHLSEFASDGGAVLMVTHDDRAKAAANRSLELKDGKIVSTS